jgi:NTE family protein
MTVWATDTAGRSGREASDGLARPVDFGARHGAGNDRTLVLGGGGIFFIAWQAGYLNGLRRRGVDVASAEIVVGTSAGAVVASVLTAGRLASFSREVGMLARLNGVRDPIANLRPSQQRALQLFSEAGEASPETLRRIGFAALAAKGESASALRTRVRLALGLKSGKWPGPALNIVTVDAYTAERLVVTGTAGVSVARAAAASASVPGLFEPQPIRDRRCVDGGVSGSGIHGDLVAGARRALVISLAASAPPGPARVTVPSGGFDRELQQLAEAGTETLSRGPRDFDPSALMSLKSVPEALAEADARAAEDVAVISEFWR